jgi:hypothetical protein
MTMCCLQVSSAGVNEIGDYIIPKVRKGNLEKPTMATVDINLLGQYRVRTIQSTIHATLTLFVSTLAAHLAIRLLELERKRNGMLKSSADRFDGSLPSCFCWLDLGPDV